jgi:hypothetical protein
MSCIQEYTSFVEKCITTTQNKSRIEKFRENVLIIKNEPQVTYINEFAMKFEDLFYYLRGLAGLYFGISALNFFVSLFNLTKNILCLFVRSVKLIFPFY